MAMKRRCVQLPEDLYNRIAAIARWRDESMAWNKIVPPNSKWTERSDTGTSFVFVIELAVREYEAHLSRSSGAFRKAKSGLPENTI